MTDQPRSVELAAEIKTLAARIKSAQRREAILRRQGSERDANALAGQTADMRRRLALLRKERKLALAAERRGKDAD